MLVCFGLLGVGMRYCGVSQMLGWSHIVLFHVHTLHKIKAGVMINLFRPLIPA